MGAVDATMRVSFGRFLVRQDGLGPYDSVDEMVKKLAAAGFTATRAPANIGHNPWRMTFVARHALVRGAEQSG